MKSTQTIQLTLARELLSKKQIRCFGFLSLHKEQRDTYIDSHKIGLDISEAYK